MSEWQEIAGTFFTPVEFDAYCRGISWDSWRASFIVLHHTKSPSLALCPEGFTKQHILSMESYYRHEVHSKAGPHLFVDDRHIWVFTPLNFSGMHSPSWNRVALGVTMLGDYDREPFHAGRGLMEERTPHPR